jgi:hypothetical protein
MASSEHSEELGDLSKLHKQGACIRRGPTHYAKSNLCSYRGQARARAEDDRLLYDWPRYQSLAEGGRVKTEAYRKRDEGGGRGWKLVPEHYKQFIAAPKQGDWDVKGNNFTTLTYRPYWHEAHHIVPSGALGAAIDAVAAEQQVPALGPAIRGALLKASYNLNGKGNLIILPIDRSVAVALELPVHRSSPSRRDHAAFSDMVERRLCKAFQRVKEGQQAHKPVDYQASKERLEDLSKDLYREIVAAGRLGVKTLEAIAAAAAGKAAGAKPAGLAQARAKSSTLKL